MEHTVYDFQDYRTYLLQKLSSYPKRGYGIRGKLAEHLNCQAAYVSQILKGVAHLSFEQAEKANAFFGHAKEEAHYFILLVSKERAGTETLKTYYQAQIEDVLQKRLVLKNRLGVTNALSENDKLTYYSQWYFAAIHIALTIPSLQTRDALAKYFGLPKSKVTEVLQFLSSCGLAEENSGQYKTGTARIHLGSDSPLVAKNHITWRIRAIQSLERDPELDLHYSTIMSISKKDVLKVKAELVKKIEELRGIVRESPEEALQSLVIDFFHV